MPLERASEDYRRFEAGLEELGMRLVFWKQRDAGGREEAIEMRILRPGEGRKAIKVSTYGRAEGEVYDEVLAGLRPKEEA